MLAGTESLTFYAIINNMKFAYTAIQPDGRIIKGAVDAQSEQAVLDFLSRNELKPISVQQSTWTIGGKIYIFGGGITTTDNIFLTRYLALMLRAGTDLFRALDILIADFEKPAVKSLLTEIRTTLEKGQPFYVTFAKYPQYFSPIFVNLVKAGEISGNLEATFDNLSLMLQKEEDLRRRIRSALLYPIVLIVASFLVVTFLVTFALPRIADVFLQGGFEPPTFSRIVFTVGLFISNNIIWLSGLLFGGVLIFWYFFFHTTTGRLWLSRILARIPVIKNVVLRIAIQRFAATLGYLLKAGLPIIDSLELTATAVGNERLKLALQRIAREGVARGLTIGDAFKRETEFPQVITNLIAVSEKAGHLEELLFTLATFYDTEIEAAIKGMVSIIEPALLIVIGGLVGLIALSVIMPIYQLVGQF